ncbi:hypothetical protein [Limosilactobacillus pontis]|uniref:hypothetical protein n=1 Tax=Limosilactobacillus pontis TaxID=35787 RepID=UPI001D23AF41|nr:hypothetical protein [Limosilactobacillus pontis]HJE27516.1 hypothetical protein [Limosilactobacillus pontis]
MRIKNLLIIIAIVAAVLLVMRYVRQVKDTRRGYNYVSGSRVAMNWLLVVLLVGSLVGIGVTSFAGHKESAAPAKSSQSSSAVEPTADDDEGDVMLKFKKTARMNDNGEAKVKFLISAKTKVVIKGHRSGVVVKTFKPSKGDDTVTRSFVFDTPGTYDITAKRGDKKVVKHLKVKGQSNDESSDSSSSSSVISQSSSSSDQSSSTSSDQSDSSTATSQRNSGGSRTSTSRSNAGYTGGSHYRGGSYGGGRGSGNNSTEVPRSDNNANSEGTDNQGLAGGGNVTSTPDEQ